MTRINKVKYLINKGEKITYHVNSTRRLIVDYVKLDGRELYFKSYSEDQAEAGKVIDLLYWDWVFLGGRNNG